MPKKSVPKRIKWWHYVLPSVYILPPELVERMKKVVRNGDNPSARYQSLYEFVVKTIEKRVEELEK